MAEVVTQPGEGSHSEALAALDPRWMERIRATADLVCGAGAELRIIEQDSEPMTNFNTGEGPHRIVNLPSAQLTRGDCDFSFIRPVSRLRRIVSQAYTRAYDWAPLTLDSYRQWRNYNSVRRNHWDFGTLDATTPAPLPPGPGEVANPDQRPTMWVAMHWLETGGAEEWAFTQAEAAADAGWRVIITADRTAPQRLLDRALAITPAVFLPGNVLANHDWPVFIRALITRYQVEAIHIHHSIAAYYHAPAIKELWPAVRITDTTHILEHRGGGFVWEAAARSGAIDTHHVISPQLRDYLLYDRQVPAAKVAYHPLTNFTNTPGRAAPASGQNRAGEQLAARIRSGQPLRLGFLGRLAVQKRPFLFVELARRLNRAAPGRYQFVMQGSGELQTLVERQIERAGLRDVIDTRPWGPTASFFDAIDILVICSENEGLTLTALEADRHETLIISADVGSQATVTIPPLCLDPRPHQFLALIQTRLQCLARDPNLGIDWMSAQASQLQQLRALESAADFCARHYQ